MSPTRRSRQIARFRAADLGNLLNHMVDPTAVWAGKLPRSAGCGRIASVNPSTALATVVVDELVRHGVREAVLCPGSRSAPLAYALQDADRAGRLRLHVRVDERSAGFLALGMAKLTRRPVPVFTTSGTAAANLHPAVLEASHAAVPLIIVSADRPSELQGTGANQTTDQGHLFGTAVRMFHQLGAPESREGPERRMAVGRGPALLSSHRGSRV